MAHFEHTPQDLSRLPIVPEALLDVPRVPYEVDITRRNALARALTPDYAGIDPSNYVDITRGMVEAVKPNNLRPDLIGVPRPIRDDSQPCVLSYYAGLGHGEIYLAVTPPEAKKIPRSVGAIRRAARITTANTVVNPFPSDSDLAREQRSGVHVHEAKLDVLKRFRDNVYMPQLMVIDKFVEASEGRRFGLQRFGDEGKMRDAMAMLQTYIFGDIARAYSRQRNLNEAQTKLVEKSITASIYLDRHRNHHLSNFAALVRFSREYVGHKKAAVDQRIEAIERQLSQDV